MKIKLFTAMIFGFLLGTQAMAEPGNDNPEGWSCKMEFTAKGKGLQVIVGKFKLKGTGLVSCESDSGELRELPVRITIGGKPVQAQVAAGWLTVHGYAKPFGISGSPESLFGDYAVAKAQVAIIGGVGTIAGVDIDKNDNLAFNIQIETVKGFGFSLGMDKFSIEPL